MHIRSKHNSNVSVSAACFSDYIAIIRCVTHHATGSVSYFNVFFKQLSVLH